MIVGADGSAFADFLHRYKNHEYEQMVINISLSVVVLSIVTSVVISMMFPPSKEPAADKSDAAE
jgi:hypothetical protein